MQVDSCSAGVHSFAHCTWSITNHACPIDTVFVQTNGLGWWALPFTVLGIMFVTILATVGWMLIQSRMRNSI